KLAACRHLIHVHRKIWIRHLFFERALEPARPAGGMKDERTALALIQRREEGNALNVVPMKVREENVRVERLAVGFLLQLLAQIAKPGATVKDVDVPIDAHFHAGSIAAITQVFRLRSGCRTAHAPESDQHHCTFGRIFLPLRAPGELRRDIHSCEEGLRVAKVYPNRRPAATICGNQMCTLRGERRTCPSGQPGGGEGSGSGLSGKINTRWFCPPIKSLRPWRATPRWSRWPKQWPPTCARRSPRS